MSDTDRHQTSLETNRLILRPFKRDDVEFVHRHFSDPAVSRYLLDSPPLKTVSEADELVSFYQAQEGDGPNRWCLVSKEDGAAVGTCGFHQIAPQHRRAEVGYDLTPDRWGRGYMIEALGAVLAFGFEKMSLHRVSALVFEANVRSVRVLEKSGFRQEGVLRDLFLSGGDFFDHALYSLLRTEWVRPPD